MDFFGHQEDARRRTSWLVGLYALAVLGIILAIYFVLAALMAVYFEPGEDAGLWMPELLLWVAVVVCAIVLSGSFFKTMQLSKGGAVVARSLGGRPLAPDTKDPNERRLLNVVEEMALAAGVAVPQVFLLDHEPGINAFAAGFTQRDAAIGVTRGCMERLSRDELQGVIAHEFSHIVNGDMRLNIRLIGVLFGILMITVVGQVLLRSAMLSGGRRSRGGKKEGGNPLPLIGLAMIIIGYIGVFFANMIKSAISRQREFLSDASAVQYTRNPPGISGALKKIGGLTEGARVTNPHAAEASHLFFGQALAPGLSSLFSTHPPLKERIRRLDPAFNPDIKSMMTPVEPGAAPAPGVSGFAGSTAGVVNLEAAASLLRKIPESLRDEVHDSVGARAAVYALLWSGDPKVQAVQREAIVTDPQVADRLEKLRAGVSSLPRSARLPLAELAAPALRVMSKDEYKLFRAVTTRLAEADSEIDLFEFALSQMILRHVEPAFGDVSSAPVKYSSIEKVLPACSTVLASLAVWGTSTREEAQICYRRGMEKLTSFPATLEPGLATLEKVAEALDTLAAAAPALKKSILDACTACVTADGKVAVEQSELLRAVADAMDVPMPPLNAD